MSAQHCILSIFNKVLSLRFCPLLKVLLDMLTVRSVEAEIMSNRRKLGLQDLLR